MAEIFHKKEKKRRFKMHLFCSDFKVRGHTFGNEPFHVQKRSHPENALNRRDECSPVVLYYFYSTPVTVTCSHLFSF